MRLATATPLFCEKVLSSASPPDVTGSNRRPAKTDCSVLKLALPSLSSVAVGMPVFCRPDDSSNVTESPVIAIATFSLCEFAYFAPVHTGFDATSHPDLPSASAGLDGRCCGYSDCHFGFSVRGQAAGAAA